MILSPLTAAAAKKPFPSVYIFDTTCFDKCFLFRVVTGRHYFLYKFIVTQRFGETTMMLYSLKQVFWKKPAFYIRYLHNNTTMLLVVSKRPQQSFYFLNLLIAFLLFQFVNVPRVFFIMELLKLKSFLRWLAWWN